MSAKFGGIIVPLLTPFDKHYEIDEEALRQHVDFLIEFGIHGLFPLASTGEFYTMTENEKRKVISIVVDQTNGRVPVISGIGYTGLNTAKELGRYSKDVGADAILAVAPYYVAQSRESLYEYYAELSTVGLPLFAYNIPQFVGYYIPVDVITKLSENGCICGIKDSSGNIMYFADILSSVGDKICVLQGQDVALLPSLVIGADGGMVGSPNIYPEFAVGIYNSYMSGNLEKAKEYHKKLVKLIKVLSIGVFPAGLKYAGEVLGRCLGVSRKPTSLTDAEKERIRAILKDLGLVE